MVFVLVKNVNYLIFVLKVTPCASCCPLINSLFLSSSFNYFLLFFSCILFSSMFYESELHGEQGEKYPNKKFETLNNMQGTAIQIIVEGL